MTGKGDHPAKSAGVLIANALDVMYDKGDKLLLCDHFMRYVMHRSFSYPIMTMELYNEYKTHMANFRSGDFNEKDIEFADNLLMAGLKENLFSLEAQGRENVYLKKLLEEIGS